MGRAGGAGGRSETHRARGRRPGGAFREARGGDGRQGDDRHHESPHRRGSLQRAHQVAARVGGGDAESRDDRQRGGRPRLAEAHPQQGQAPQAGEPLQGRQGPVPHCHRARYVADRLRRTLPAQDVCRQAHARPRAHAGHRPREPRLSRQARRAGGGLSRPRRSAQEGAHHLHRERRSGRTDLRHRASHRRDADSPGVWFWIWRP